MPLPFILGGAAVALAGTGIKKGLNARKKNQEAEQLIISAENRLAIPLENFKKEQRKMEVYLSDFARFKVMVFKVQIQNFIDFIKTCKNSANSELNIENISFTDKELHSLESEITKVDNISSGLVKGTTSGALIAFGTYGAVGTFATASTGTAIGTLSGAAATNATLAWLGGGSLAAGGGGMAVGAAVLGGVVAAPLIAIAGFSMDSKAEKNLTAAHEYSEDVDIEIDKMLLKLEEFKGLKDYIDELGNTIVQISDKFDKILKKINKRKDKCKSEKTKQLFILGKGLKNHLDISLLNKKGKLNQKFNIEMQKVAIS